MKKIFKISLSIFLSILMCCMAVPVMAAEAAEEAYGEAFQVYMPLHYLQSDTEWANDPTACGSTIGQVGCAITSFAMILKHFNINKDPGDVNADLGEDACPFMFFEAGNEYGLSTVEVYYSDTATLSELNATNRIREQLRVSRPVLVGMKTSSGKTHFVVAYSYVDMEPGGSPIVSILDPSILYGYTTLSQYYNAGWGVYRLYAYY